MMIKRSISTLCITMISNEIVFPVVIRRLTVAIASVFLFSACAHEYENKVDLSEIADRHLALDVCKQKFQSRYYLPSPNPDQSIAEWLLFALPGPERMLFTNAHSEIKKIDYFDHAGAGDFNFIDSSYNELVRQFELANTCGLNSGLSDLGMLEDVIFSRALSIGIDENLVADEKLRRKLIVDMIFAGSHKGLRGAEAIKLHP